MSDLGFIGLGVMGASMAGHLLAAGHRLRLHTRSRTKAEPLLARGAVWCDSPQLVAAQSEAVITSVGFPCDVEQVYLGGESLLSGLRPDGLLIDMSTSSPALAVRIAAAARERGGQALDAPVSGGDKGAREAQLSIMVGGDAAAFERARPIFALLGTNIVHHGPAGSGQHCKLSNQIAIAANMIGVCEALAYARTAGLDPKQVLTSISSGAAGSWSLSNLAPRILAGDLAPGFFVKHFVKDMVLATESAAALGLDTPGLDLALALYRRLVEQGGAEQGTQALSRLYGE